MSVIIDLTLGQYGDDAMADINTNFDTLNTDKLETSAYTDATTSSAGKTRLSVAPASPTVPIAVGDNDPRIPTALQVGYIPTAGEKAALPGNNTDIDVGAGNKYFTQTGFQKRAETYAATATGNDTYVVTLSPVPTSLVNGMKLSIKLDVGNTGPATLNVNGLGAVSMVTGLSTALVTGDTLANQIIDVEYNSTGPVWQVLNPASMQTTAFNPVFDSLTFSRSLATASGTQVVNHSLGKTPKLISFGTVGVNIDVTGSTETVNCPGGYDGTTNNCATTRGEAGNTSNTYCIVAESIITFGKGYQGAVTAWDSTTFTITWTKTGSPTGTFNILANLSA